LSHSSQPLEDLMRERVQHAIELTVEQELLGAASSARVGAQLNRLSAGPRDRTMNTSFGASSIAMPQARIQG